MADAQRDPRDFSVLADFYAGIVFLTRFPAPDWSEGARRPLAVAMWTFPMVGVIVAAVPAALYAAAAAFGMPALLSALIAVAAAAMVTGGLHEDGLADFADGVGGGTTPEERLRIMSDSRTGVYGVLALVVSVAGRAVAIAGIGDALAVFGALAATAALSRGLLPAVMASMEPAKTEGLGWSAGRPAVAVWATSLGIGVAVVVLAAPGGWTGCLLAAGLGAFAVALIARHAVRGYTGDVLGAAQQVSEFLALAVIAAVMTQGG